MKENIRQKVRIEIKIKSMNQISIQNKKYLIIKKIILIRWIKIFSKIMKTTNKQKTIKFIQSLLNKIIRKKPI